jgi:hypothetical protein
MLQKEAGYATTRAYADVCMHACLLQTNIARNADILLYTQYVLHILQYTSHIVYTLTV